MEGYYQWLWFGLSAAGVGEGGLALDGKGNTERPLPSKASRDRAGAR